MSDKIYTDAELKQFDRLTLSLSSPRQLTRINARLRLADFQKEHGTEKCDAMFAVLKARDRKRAPPRGEHD